MGLSAGQARLLTITARKSDCEYQSMQLSHQKLAISRQLEDVSNEYQNSLEQTKLVYDFYGTGTTDTPLSYSLLMTPSELNQYMPNLVTNSSGRVVLDSKLANAAKAAGIPQEGLSGTPSDIVRNMFLLGLKDQNIISESRYEKFIKTSYNPLAGLGSLDSIQSCSTEMSYDEFVDMLDSVEFKVDPTDTTYNTEKTRGVGLFKDGDVLVSNNASDWGNLSTHEQLENSITIGDLLSDDYVLVGVGQDYWNSALLDQGCAADAVLRAPFWGEMFDMLESVLDTGDPYTQTALAYARNQVEDMLYYEPDLTHEGGHKVKGDKGWAYDNYQNVTHASYFGRRSEGDGVKVFNSVSSSQSQGVLKYSLSNKDGYIGLVGQVNTDTGHDNHNGSASAVAVNVSTLLKSYLTFFASKMQGTANSPYYVGMTTCTSNFVDDGYIFNVYAGSNVTDEEMKIVNFYDALLNQLCTRGWTENEQVDDNSYLQEMFQNGMLFLTKVADDGYYYQGNYATDPYIKTVEDETKIAQASANYELEKQKLNSKENTLDLKIKNLDTEISALTTEYDSVKSTISKNIERTFKRYNA